MAQKDYSIQELMRMPLDELVKLDYTKLSKEGKLVVIKRDPVMWAKSFIQIYNIDLDKYAPWCPRWYQAEMLRDRSLRKVFRCGRRCVADWSELQDPYTGEIKTVKELLNTNQNFSTLALDDNYQVETVDNCSIMENGIKPLYRVTTQTGRQIDATDNHPLLTALGWQEIKDLTVGEYIGIPTKLNYFGDNSIEETELKLLARKINKDKFSEKTLPKEIFTLNKEAMSIFVSELILDAFDTTENKPIEMLYHSCSRKLVKQLSHLLLRFGIITKIEQEDDKYSLGFNSSKLYRKIRNKSRSRAMYCIYHSYKYQQVSETLNQLFLGEMKLNPLDKKDFKKVEFGRLSIEEFLKSRPLNKNEAREFANLFKYEGIEDILYGDIYWDKIVSIEYLGEYPTYHINVPGYHNFISDDIISHNTGKTETMVVEALFNVFTRRNFIHMFVTPYQSQVRMIFDNIRQKIDSSALIKREVTRSTTNPFLLEFSNGSKIVGFTTGAGSGMSAASIRGWRADWISLDEMDYMGEGDFDTVYALCMERDTIGMTCSSTPTGRRSKFYEICVKKELGLK